ncbi:hypothetical protein Tco_1063105 [Tanacetum coccineum]
MDLISFIQTVDPTKVRVGERQLAEDEPRLLDTTVGHVVPLLLIAPARAESELDASVDKLFDESGNGNQAEQGDSVSGGHGVGIQLVSEAAETVVEDAAPMQPRRQRKRKTVVSDAGKPSHTPKKLREDHGTLSGASIGGKSRSAVQRLLAGAVQNAKVRGEPIPTLPFVTSSVFATPEREDEAHTDSATGLNLRTIGAPPRFIISSNSSHHSGANILEAEVDSFARPSVPLMTVATTVNSTVDPATTVKEKFVESSIFGGDSSGGGADHTAVYVPQWSVTNGSRLDGSRTCREMVDEFAPPKFFASIRGMEHDQLFTEFNVEAARQMSLSAEARDEEIESLKAQLLVKEAEAAEAIRLRAEASKFKVVERSLRDEVKVLKEQNAALEQEKIDLSVKVADLATLVKVGEQEVADLDAQVTFVKSQSDNFMDRVHELEGSSAGLQEKVTAYEGFIDQLEKFQDEKMKLNENLLDYIPGLVGGYFTMSWNLTIAKCLNSTEYLSTLGAAIGKAVEKGMRRAICRNYPRWELKSNKDASVDTIMNLLRLDDTLDEKLGLTESQPYVNQLMVPIHHSPDQRVIGASALSLSLDVSSSRVRKIKENISNHVSALRGVFVPLSDPLSAVALEGMEGTFGGAPGTVDTTTALSTVVASNSIVRPISIDDYEVTGADDQANADGNVAGKDANPFPNVDDA